MMKTVTIFIPCYNRKGYISQSLKSVLSQDYEPKQVVVIDDGSTDGSYQVLKRLQKKWKFDLLRTDKPRRGTYWISNCVMRQYSSEYYQVCDSDDILLPGVTKRMIDFMEEEKAGVVGGQYVYIDNRGRPFTQFQHWRPYNANYAYKIKRNPHISRGGMIWQKSVTEKVGPFIDTMRCTADYEFGMRCLEEGIKIRNVNFVIAKVRFHPDSLSTSRFFGTNNKENERNRRLINRQYPPYYNIRARYLDFFQSEFQRLGDQHNQSFEDQLLRYCAELLFENKVDDVQAVKSLVVKTTAQNPMREYVQGMLAVREGMRTTFERIVRRLCARRYTIPLEQYRLASFCEKHDYGVPAQRLFKNLLHRRNVPHGVRAGVWFHIGDMYHKQYDFKRAKTCYEKCLALDGNHKTCKARLRTLPK